MEQQMAAYVQQLERESKEEQEKFDRNFENLGRRRDEIIKSRKEKARVNFNKFLACLHKNSKHL